LSANNEALRIRIGKNQLEERKGGLDSTQGPLGKKKKILREGLRGKEGKHCQLPKKSGKKKSGGKTGVLPLQWEGD